MRYGGIILGALMLSGCGAASAVVDLATLPVRGASKVVDAATVSQSERDQQRGQDIRRREERLGELDREYEKQSRRCAEGNDEACRKRDAAYAEIRTLLPGVPYEPR
ncbi:hypothetical protein [Novosphingobium sp.]|uniref:hypothetical protein n=1 Tax=Novosphingobium sp. TaxID=1874826 RepID=UPI0027343C42|nr:hypothetical protein [Novosphingobium sp.]MDP3906246.1 hypothetical protein [Novosphingobium sp.]